MLADAEAEGLGDSSPVTLLLSSADVDATDEIEAVGTAAPVTTGDSVGRAVVVNKPVIVAGGVLVTLVESVVLCDTEVTLLAESSELGEARALMVSMLDSEDEADTLLVGVCVVVEAMEKVATAEADGMCVSVTDRVVTADALVEGVASCEVVGDGEREADEQALVVALADVLAGCVESAVMVPEGNAVADDTVDTVASMVTVATGDKEEDGAEEAEYVP